MSCAHPEPHSWRAGKYEPDGRHGPPLTRQVDGRWLVRTWALCAGCGERLERAEPAQAVPRG